MEKFGIAGYGGRGKLIARKLVDLGYEVVGVQDSNPAQLVDAPFRTFCRLEQLLNLPLTALVVAAWPSAHTEIACAALDRDLDVFVEKPMGSTLAESLKIADAQRRSGRIVIVGYVERTNPAIVKLREIADLASVARSRELRVGLSPPMDSSGVLLDLASHGIDMAYHLFRFVPVVTSASLTVEHEGKSEYGCTLEFDCGRTLCHVEARRTNFRRRRLEVETEREYYEVTYTPSSLKVGFSPPKLGSRPRSFEDLEQLSRNVETHFDIRRKEPVIAMLHLAAESFRKGSVLEPLCSAQEALVTAHAIDRARRIASSRSISRSSVKT